MKTFAEIFDFFFSGATYPQKLQTEGVKQIPS